jgi:hypothetical protein
MILFRGSVLTITNKRRKIMRREDSINTKYGAEVLFDEILSDPDSLYNAENLVIHNNWLYEAYIPTREERINSQECLCFRVILGIDDYDYVDPDNPIIPELKRRLCNCYDDNEEN